MAPAMAPKKLNRPNSKIDHNSLFQAGHKEKDSQRYVQMTHNNIYRFRARRGHIHIQAQDKEHMA